MDATQERRTIQPDDLFRLKFLQGAQLCPDGKTIVYAVSHIESDKVIAGRDDADEYLISAQSPARLSSAVSRTKSCSTG